MPVPSRLVQLLGDVLVFVIELWLFVAVVWSLVIIAEWLVRLVLLIAEAVGYTSAIGYINTF